MLSAAAAFLSDPKSPEPCLVLGACVAYADAGQRLIFGAGAVVLKPEPVPGVERQAVVGAGDAEIPCGASRTGGALNPAYQHGLGVPGGSGDYIEKVIHPVAEVNIHNAALGEKHLGARGPAPAGVAGGVLLAIVAFGLGYPGADNCILRGPDTYYFAEQLREVLLGPRIIPL